MRRRLSLFILTKRHSSKTKALESVQLRSDIWTSEVYEPLENIKQLIAERVIPGHLNPAKRLFMNTNASEHY